MPEVGVEGQRKLKAAQRAVHRRRRARLAGGALSRGRRRRHARHRRLRRRSTSATCSGRSSTARPTSAGRSCSRRATGCTRINPDIADRHLRDGADVENALELFRDYDVIVDGTDNFPTRYLVNDACVLLGKPNVYGSIFRFEGQASVFAAPGRPVLSLPLSRAAAARARAELRRRRRARRAARASSARSRRPRRSS